MRQLVACFAVVALAGCMGGAGDFGGPGGGGSTEQAIYDDRCAEEGQTEIGANAEGVALYVCSMPDPTGLGTGVGDILENREWPGSGPDGMYALQDAWDSYILADKTVGIFYRLCRA